MAKTANFRSKLRRRPGLQERGGNASHLEHHADLIISRAPHFEHLLWWHLFFSGMSRDAAARRLLLFTLQLLHSFHTQTNNILRERNLG